MWREFASDCKTHEASMEDKPSSSIHSLAQGIGKFQRRIFHLLMQSPNTSNDTNYSCFQNKLYNESTLMRMERIARDLEARINRMITEETNTCY